MDKGARKKKELNRASSGLTASNGNAHLKLDLIKFPRTRHIFNAGGQGVSRDDLLMTTKEAAQFLKGKIITVEEKVDGANIGISINNDFKIRVQNRSHYITSCSHRQFSTLDNWLSEHSTVLIDILDPEKTILFGEWLHAKHSIHYTKLPSNFVAFDIFDVEENKFYSRRERDKILEGTGIPSVPLINEKVFKSKEELLPLLDTKSSFYDGPVEGIYLRVDADTQPSTDDTSTIKDKITKKYLLNRAKLVRPDFLQQIEEQWTRQKFTKNIVQYVY